MKDCWASVFECEFDRTNIIVTYNCWCFGLFCNEARKDFSKAERIDYARRLERIESLKAEKRKSATQFGNNAVRQISDTPQRTDDLVAKKLNIGSRDTYRKEKYIVDNQDSLTPKDFSEWDEGILSFNPVKLGRCFIFLNKYYGFERGGNGSNQYEQKAKILTIANPNIPSNQIELADSYNITRQTMNNYMRMASMIPELEDLVDTGIVIAENVTYLLLIIMCAYDFWSNSGLLMCA